MKKVIRLTESDLVRLVKRVVKEEESDSKPVAYHDLVGGWYDTNNEKVDEPTDYSEEMSFGPEDYKKFIKFINDCDTSWCLKTKKMYKLYTNKGNIIVRK